MYSGSSARLGSERMPLCLSSVAWYWSITHSSALRLPNRYSKVSGGMPPSVKESFTLSERGSHDHCSCDCGLFSCPILQRKPLVVNLYGACRYRCLVPSKTAVTRPPPVCRPLHRPSLSRRPRHRGGYAKKLGRRHGRGKVITAPSPDFGFVSRCRRYDACHGLTTGTRALSYSLRLRVTIVRPSVSRAPWRRTA